MALRIFNSQTGKKEDFTPIKENEVSIYSCGPTVYNYVHIGNLRGPIVMDLVTRHFKHLGFKVNYVVNFTDIDDKIIKSANEQNKNIHEFCEFYIQAYMEDLKSLNIQEASHRPRATEFIPGMIALVEILVAKSYAYHAPNGDTYFNVRKFGNYLKLTHRKLEDLEEGSRVEVDENKEYPHDFVLWKKSKENEPFWETPWGVKGRPGWHLECSVMATHFLGNTIDIHHGGKDLQFPHHENEIAQCECATGTNFVNLWMHHGMINVDSAKMSKSLGNFFVGRDFLQKFGPEIYRMLVLNVHYRSDMEAGPDAISSMRALLDRVYTARFIAEELVEKSQGSEEFLPQEKQLSEDMKAFATKLYDSLNDDFNFSQALGHFMSLVRDFNSQLQTKKKISFSLAQLFLEQWKLISNAGGVFQQEKQAYETQLVRLWEQEFGFKQTDVNNLISERNEARKLKNFQRADEVRKKLSEMHVEIMDKSEGTTWRPHFS